jgi:hypothetical protein
MLFLTSVVVGVSFDLPRPRLFALQKFPMCELSGRQKAQLFDGPLE